MYSPVNKVDREGEHIVAVALTLPVNFMPIRLATPGGTLTSWMTIGRSRRQAAR